MHIECTEKDGITVIAVGGELDVATAPTLQKRMANLIEDGHTKLVFDFHDLKHITSSGLAVLAYCYKLVTPKNGLVAVASASGMVKEIIGVWAGSNPQFVPTYPNVEDAVNALSKEI